MVGGGSLAAMRGDTIFPRAGENPFSQREGPFSRAGTPGGCGGSLLPGGGGGVAPGAGPLRAGALPPPCGPLRREVALKSFFLILSTLFKAFFLGGWGEAMPPLK